MAKCRFAWIKHPVVRCGKLTEVWVDSETQTKKPMIALITPMFAAAGYSLIYLLLGGGLGGAVIIFLIAKMLGR